LRFENGREHTVIGVVAAVRQRGLDGAFTPTVYMPTSLFLWPGMTLVVRTNGEIAPLIPAMHEVARRVAPGTPLYDVASLAERVASSTVTTRAQAVAVTAFATTAVLFAALGVAGMLAFGVAQRSAELALRMALGASHKRVVGQVMRRGLALGIAGIAIGLFGSQGVRGLIAGSLGDAHSGPGWTVLPVLALLLAVAALASWLPARRATRISPSQALRHE
jgi:ABC-type antimicrobial peptide transport system permease subunit